MERNYVTFTPQGGAKSGGHKLMTIFLSNLNLFTKLFHWKIPW